MSLAAAGLAIAGPGVAPEFASAQTRQAPATAPAPASTPAPLDGPRLRIGVTAVEIDAVVTDRDGRHLTDLRPEEFEIEQDGRKQTVISAQYIPLDPPLASAGEPDTDTAAPARPTRREDVRHSMAIVIDDLNLTFESAGRMRKALPLFIERAVRPGDLVAIIRASQTGSRFQPFTDDKQELLDAASRVHHNIMTAATSPVNEGGKYEREAYMLAALETVGVVIRAMREMPGRKSVLLVNEGFTIVKREGGGFRMPDPRLLDMIRQLTDDASRSFVVIYGLDARGFIGLEANVDGDTPWDSAEGPTELTSLSGGLQFSNINDLGGAMARVLEDQRGYYLIGYQPDDETFKKDERKRAKFHAVKVRVTRPEARVRSRAGFLGVTDDELKEQKAGPAPGRARPSNRPQPPAATVPPR
jgi:VWFA-related protein